jgi:hypothetical protein
LPPLAELQTQMRRAIAGGGDGGIVSHLAGPRHPAKRLAIHRRHYETSLVNALLQKFPATAWLVGTPLLADTARAFARSHPPTAPCIAEYGQDFPAFLSARREASALPYLRDFSELEWHVGHVSVAVDAPSLTIATLSSIDAGGLPDFQLKLQPGLRYLAPAWPVDELMRLFLSDSAPASLALEREQIGLELRGARGAFDFARLGPAEFSFRHAIAGGATIAVAAEGALQLNAAFDLTAAFSRLFAEALVIAVTASAPPDRAQ